MKFMTMTLSVVAMIGFLGCGSSTEAPSAGHADHHDEEAHDEEAHDEHGHPSEGPHHGSLIELGNEEYHAEMVHDDASGTVLIYLLDSAAKMSVPISATELLVNLTHDGAAEQFTLMASPQSSDPSGKSSRFISTDEELAEDLDLEEVEAKLVVTIDGKQYRGDIQHDHDEDHDEDGHHGSTEEHGHGH